MVALSVLLPMPLRLELCEVVGEAKWMEVQEQYFAKFGGKLLGCPHLMLPKSMAKIVLLTTVSLLPALFHRCLSFANHSPAAKMSEVKTFALLDDSSVRVV